MTLIFDTFTEKLSTINRRNSIVKVPYKWLVFDEKEMSTRNMVITKVILLQHV